MSYGTTVSQPMIMPSTPMVSKPGCTSCGGGSSFYSSNVPAARPMQNPMPQQVMMARQAQPVQRQIVQPQQVQVIAAQQQVVYPVASSKPISANGQARQIVLQDKVVGGPQQVNYQVRQVSAVSNQNMMVGNPVIQPATIPPNSRVVYAK